MPLSPAAAAAPDSSPATILFRILRVGTAMCFIGHGAFGVLTKKAWLPYFAVGGIHGPTAWQLMPLIGGMDIAMGVLALLWPCRALFLWASAWTVWTALCRPLAGEGWPEFFERAGNYGVPIATLALVGLHAPWFARLAETPAGFVGRTRDRVAWILRVTTATLLAGHGACGVILQKASLAQHYAVLAPGRAAALVPAVGWFEFFLALLVLVFPVPSVLVALCAWKLGCESLFLFSGAPAPYFEMLERGGSYLAPLALAWLIRGSRRPDPLSPAATALPA